MKWENEFPKEPGFYWFKKKDCAVLYCAYVIKFFIKNKKDFKNWRVYMTGFYDNYEVNKNGLGCPEGKWMGPIEEPSG